MLTLGQAARLTGTSKKTLTRAIDTGRLSGIRRDDGSYEIDLAELARVLLEDFRPRHSWFTWPPAPFLGKRWPADVGVH